MGKKDSLFPFPVKVCRAHEANLETIIRAAKSGDLGLMECKVKATGEVVAVLCAFSRHGSEIEMVPFASMFNGDPYELLSAPVSEGGFEL